jgi:hypothetical protein
MTDLRAALMANRNEVEIALQAAQGELAECRRRCEELQDLIERARSLLGVQSSPALHQRTLHDAMELVLAEIGGPMSARGLADEINRRALYRRRDGRPVDAAQIHARVSAYSGMFVRQAGLIVRRAA